MCDCWYLCLTGRKGLKTQTHSQPASSRASSESNYSATEPVQPTPLRLVVQDAVRRWSGSISDSNLADFVLYLLFGMRRLDH